MKKNMFYILVALLTVNTGTSYSQEIRSSVNKTFKNISNVDVEGAFCDVYITGENRNDVIFTGEIVSPKDYDILINYETIDGTLKIWIKKPRSVRGKTKGKIQLIIPHNININVTNSSGSITVENISKSNIKLTSASGSIHVRNIDTDITMTTSSGGISVKDVTGDTHITTTSGSINVSGLNGSLYSVSSSGNQKIEGVKGNVKITSSSGSIHMNMINGNINARTASGSIMVEQANGNMIAMSSSGSIKLDNITGTINLITTSGSQRGSGIKLTGDSSFKSSSGSVNMELLNDIYELNFEIYSSSGDIYAKGTKATHKLIKGNGPIKVYGKTSSGNQSYK
ncbi:MAG: DUF4097 family beta strand repeat protein [Chlorobi bacterium]|nr:DUF4097 family beta strand repeat protein [Chlorobiota bacterium]